MGVKSSALLPATPAGLHWAPYTGAGGGRGGGEGPAGAATGCFRETTATANGGGAPSAGLGRRRSQENSRVGSGRSRTSLRLYFLAY